VNVDFSATQAFRQMFIAWDPPALRLPGFVPSVWLPTECHWAGYDGDASDHPYDRLDHTSPRASTVLPHCVRLASSAA